ncbi:hypothetical protein DPM13_03670 [Paracoccus mutanolyticus]|uniref:Uncharacterized protein n=1 Tax=Paracoccus mutanolyticus TaxID=1499308 RepID=A0ABM6WPY2_9RHOB|nr:hypothetical protein [Paracoccus mutanolyticus]AWX92611.1 hypothetical protein DPM13_03670 [Paracoccus mutanolyticus]
MGRSATRQKDMARRLGDNEQEAARLSELAPSGWVLAFNYTPFGPELMDSTFPQSWQQVYGTGSIFMHDPGAHLAPAHPTAGSSANPQVTSGSAPDLGPT